MVKYDGEQKNQQEFQLYKLEQNLITEHIRIDFGAVLKSIIESFKNIIGSSLAKGMGVKIALA